MKRNCKNSCIRIILCMIVLFWGIGGFRTVSVYAASAQRPVMSSSMLILKQGQRHQLSLKNASASKVKWSSSGPSVASVTSGGRVTAKRRGIAVVTAKYKSVSYKCRVYVFTSNKSCKAAGLLSRNKPSGNQGCVILAGSSSIALWKSSATALSPLNTINIGVSDTKAEDWMDWFPDMIVKYRPKAVVIYLVGNGIRTRNASGTAVGRRLCSILKDIRKKLPDTQIYYISIFPTPERTAYWKETTKSNKVVKTYCESDQNSHYIDIVPGFFRNNRLRKDIFADGLHLNRKGYQIWDTAVRKAFQKNGLMK